MNQNAYQPIALLVFMACGLAFMGWMGSGTNPPMPIIIAYVFFWVVWLVLALLFWMILCGKVSE